MHVYISMYLHVHIHIYIYDKNTHVYRRLIIAFGRKFIGSRHCTLTSSLQVPGKCTDLNLTILFILI